LVYFGLLTLFAAEWVETSELMFLFSLSMYIVHQGYRLRSTFFCLERPLRTVL
ncbi:hypothetical protein S83_056157, partial [Arachis hypogaea]